jgi:hypothetical protein
VRVLRWISALLCGAYGLINIVPLVVTYGAKAGWLPLPNDMPELARLVDVVAWWQAVVWLTVIILYFMVAWRLIRRRAALGIFVLAYLTDLLRWVPMRAMKVYAQTFTAAELEERYIAFGVLLLIGAAIWWIERRPTLRSR